MDIEHQNMDIGFEYFANRCMMPKNDNREDMIMQTANSACIGVAHQSENAFDKKTILEYWCKYFPNLEESQACLMCYFCSLQKNQLHARLIKRLWNRRRCSPLKMSH